MATRGERRHLVTLEEPDGPRVPDGDGSYTQPYKAMSPSQLYAAIKPLTTRDMERQVSGGLITSEALLVTIDFHEGVTTSTRLSWLDPAGRLHAANVTGVNNPDQRCIELVLTAVETAT